jgi:hypothetical protein
MWRIKQIMKLNNGDCQLIAGENKYHFEGHPYCQNGFIMTFVMAEIIKKKQQN